MSRFYACAEGHQWEAVDSDASPVPAQGNVCPVCGGVPESDFISEPAPSGGEKTEDDTPPPTGLSPNPTPVERLHIPGYEVLGVLGRGGMGVVYRALQLKLKRPVALKMILAGAHAGPHEMARFQREAEAVGHLQHSNIVQIFEVGEQEGQQYYSMELMEGGSLAKQLAGKPLPNRQAAVLVETVARAMQAAHDRGIVHRDLKPSNVLLTADGTPKISDFGLAKRLDQDGDLTYSGIPIGTPNYMAPEQAAGKAKEVGPAADIYALGAILYELLTGRPPFRMETAAKTLQELQIRDPVALRTLNPRVDAELEAVCLKCLEKNPQHRYPSAQALADDLERWLSRLPTKERPRGRLARVRKAVARHRRLTAVTALVGFAALIAAIVAYRISPDRELEKINRELVAGKPVVLIPDNGPPRWFQPRTRLDKMNILKEKYKEFSLESFSGPSLMALHPAPPIRSYRFSVLVRHDDWAGTEQGATVGIYFAYGSTDVSRGGTVHDFCTVEFSDLTDIRARIGDPKLEGNPVEFTIQRYVEPPEQDRLRRARLSRPFNPSRDAFRALAVEINPRTIRAFWERQLLGELTFEQIRRSAEMQLATDSGTVKPVLRDFSQTGGLGLFVYRGKATFRSAEITPIDPDDR